MRKYQILITNDDGIESPDLRAAVESVVDKGYWNKVEAYVAKHTEAQFSHSICPSCLEKYYPEVDGSIKKERTRNNS